jgi:hypothetical protein
MKYASSSLVVLATVGALTLIAGCSCSSGTGGGGGPRRDAAIDTNGDATGALDASGDADAGPTDAGRHDEICNGVDDNLDGRVDEGCACAPGSTQSCWPGDPALAGVGLCAPGTQTCLATTGMEFGAWGACTGATPPDVELCDMRDNDCDGVVDNGCTCTVGDTQSCYTGPSGTEGIGRCRAGTERCTAGAGGVGTSFGACTGEVLPGTETCNGIDDNCDGAIDEGCGCTDGTSRPCYTGPTGTEGVGLCMGGTQFCTPDATGMAAWGSCSGVTLPAPDVCNGIDDNCDGTIDEGCHCAPGSVRACWDGPAAAEGIGLCRDGMQTCVLSTDRTSADWGACTGERLPAAELCNGTDDNCDGMIDEGCGCPIGMTRPCYSGPPDTLGYGACVGGMQTCVAATDGSGMWGACSGEVTPGSEVCGDSIDGDCDGVIDDGCNCTSGMSRACYAGPASTRGVGLCRDGSQSCVVGAGGVGADWGTCTGGTLPAAEICDGLDNNCNGTRDEGCGCTPGTIRSCYGGPAGTQDVGICLAGSQTCDTLPDGSASWSACGGAVLPGTETCNGRDDNCNGVIDEGCSCSPGATQTCYTGPAATRGIGICADGAQTCVAGTSGSSWGACGGDTTPGTETCNGRDDNCNGATDEGCSCTPRSTRSCYSGPTGTAGMGICHAGTQSCDLAPDGTSSNWGACTGAQLPGAEVCNGVDDDCNGIVDDGCNCVPGSTRACYGGPAGTRMIGICRDGTQSCVSGAGGVGSDWGACVGWSGPVTEICNGSDDNCDGRLDEGCACTAGSTRACYSGAPATRMVGVCRDGSQTCSYVAGVAQWSTCSGERLPSSETCNMADDNCNGTVDENVCLVPPIVTCPTPLTTRPFVAVTLTGAATDPDGGAIASWSWTLVSAPAGASGTFSSPSSQTTQFTPNLVGVYTIRLTVVDDDGMSASCTTTVTATGLGIRVEVIWNTASSDVDTHLLRMASGSPWFNTPNDCYYANRTPSWDAAGTADDPRLDIDDVDGFGPENINVDVPVTGNTYRVGIHYYSDHGAGASSVTVRIYCGDVSVTPVATYSRTLSNGAGASDSNDFWRVADVRWLGGDSCSVAAINTLTTGTVARTTP